MENTSHRVIAIVGLGAVLPDAPNVAAFWDNIKRSRYSITEVTPDRWDPALYYDADHSAPDKTYSKIGGWVREFTWEPAKWRVAIPPRVVEAMDEGQRWAIASTRDALEDSGYPNRALDLDRTAVILGNAMAGEKHYLTALRLYFPEYARELGEGGTFQSLPRPLQNAIRSELKEHIGRRLPAITEDSMPGELANCLAGRIANVFNCRGPNFVTDAACASALAAITAAVEGLLENRFDAAITGGIDRNMGAPTFVKFCKIGALSATGSRPYAEGADGFVMGEGAAVFLLKRLADAERDGNKIYAVLRGIGASSDGKGKGITAPNPLGQKFAIERAWENAGLSPATMGLIEGHGTSTRVGDVVEVESLAGVLNGYHLSPTSIALGSVKSNIGHLKGAAGAAGLLKAVLALHEKVLPPTVQFEHPNPDIDFAHCPLYVNTELRPWDTTDGEPRRAGVSAFGFGGTNFHAVLEEYVPERLTGSGKRLVAVGEREATLLDTELCLKAPLRGALVVGAPSPAALAERLRDTEASVNAGWVPAPAPPTASDLRSPERVVIDYGDAAELGIKAAKALKALAADQPPVWKALRAQGIFHGRGPAAKVAFLYTGQGSQYVNMLQSLYSGEPIVADTFVEADRVMTPLLGKPLSSYVFVPGNDAGVLAQAEQELRQTSITQPAVLAADIALTRLLSVYGIEPDLTMGHSLGEYGALVAAGALQFSDALEAVSARGREMTRVALADNGRMAAVFAPLQEVERILDLIDGYVVIANINSNRQAVIGGASKAVELAIAAFEKAGYNVVPLPVSHAFHTSIVAPASEPLRRMLERLRLQPPRVPVAANVTGDFYPTGSDALPRMLDLLGRQIASPVQFVKGLQTLHAAGARVFVEIGPKKALQGFVEDVLGDDDDVISLFTNHPKVGDIVAFNQALCGLYAAGRGRGAAGTGELLSAPRAAAVYPVAPAANNERYTALGRLFSEVLERGWEIYHGPKERAPGQPVVITGAALGLPGTAHIFDDSNLERILRGDQFIDVIPTRLRRAILDKHITRLVKSDDGNASFETITSAEEVIKLAGRGGALNLEHEFGVPAERVEALDRVTQLAIGVGIDALRDAGIPLVLRYRTTSKGTQLPDRWSLPEPMRDDTGIIFASVFPGYGAFADEMSRYYADRGRREQMEGLEQLRNRIAASNGDSLLFQEVERRINELREAIQKQPYVFDRRFIFRILSMGHSQFAEFIGARGPNTQINAACATTTQAISLAEDWIRSGRCRRVVIVSADDITSDQLFEWFGAAFLATGAAATDELVEEAAIPFDRRRHGMICGMGAAAIVIESAEAARERGLMPICAVLSAVTANSAFHGTRLDVEHISQIMEELIAKAEVAHGISRQEIAPHTIFVSHETYTPARGGSSAAEIHALRRVFGAAADQIVIANTKGMTGHAMGTGIEDVVAVKALETGCVPPVPNFKEVDPELGILNLSKGGVYPVQYALRLGAGFGSQISMTLLRFMGDAKAARPRASALGYAYRIVNPPVWKAWIEHMAGHNATDLEVVHRTLRVRTVAPVTEVPETIVTATPPPQAAGPATLPEVPTEIHALTTNETGECVSDPVKERILALIAEKTGYRVDMLALDLDLEADLGIDTVKQAEMFASIRETYNIPRDQNLKLRDFPTLAHVIRFVYDKRPDLAAPVVSVAATPSSEPAQPAVPLAGVAAPAAPDNVQEKLLDIVATTTGYPKEMLALDLDLEADLGIDTVKQAEMFASIRETYNIPRDQNLKLRDFPTLAHVIRFIYNKRPDLAAPAASVAPTIFSEPAQLIAPIESAAVPAAPDNIEEKILDIVEATTGYPKEMLAFDLDLEADLGIDTVKQAEMFASVRAAFDIPRDASLKLRDFPTLAHVIQFARDRRPQPQSRELSENGAAGAAAATPHPQQASMNAANSVPRRLPVPVLRPPLRLCKSSGVTLSSGSRVVIMPDHGGVADELARRLQSVAVEVLVIDEPFEAKSLQNRLETWLAHGPITGIYWLPALENEGNVHYLDHAQWHEGLRIRVKLFHAAMRALYEQVASPANFLVAATRLGGRHGYDHAGAVAPMGGAVSGFTKAYKWERPDALVKAVDFDVLSDRSEIAQCLIDETLFDPGAVEIGHKDEQRWTVGLEEHPARENQLSTAFNQDSVFLITGAAGSIVSAITADLAAASAGTFYLLDLVQEPAAGDADVKRFFSDKEGLKRDLTARLQARGARPTPAAVERELSAVERAHAARTAIDAIKAAGGTAEYFSVDLRDAAAVEQVIRHVRDRSGRIDFLIHAAGMERSHLLPEKDPGEFDLVFDVKADGWFNLIHSIGNMPLGATVVFSSVAGRFGNRGQTDYSSANDLLCKLTSNFRTARPATHGIAIDWTAWSGIGMASRGSIPKMMESAGIEMLTAEAGIPIVRREMAIARSSFEVVIARGLGTLGREWDSAGGLDPAKIKLEGPMLGRAVRMSVSDGLVIETTLDPKLEPFLHDHQIEGIPVLPGVMGVEFFAEAARALLPEWHVRAVEDVTFLLPFKFYRNEPRTATIRVQFQSQGDEIVADCMLTATRLLPNQMDPEVTKHFTGLVRLAKQPLAAKSNAPANELTGTVIDAADIYRIYFHGPAYRVIERVSEHGSRAVGLMAQGLPPSHQASGQPLTTAPRLLELCFQTAGVWEILAKNRLGLPQHIDRVLFHRPPAAPPGRVFSTVTARPQEDTFDAEVTDSVGSSYLELTGYRTIALPWRVDSDLLKARVAAVA